MSDDDDLLSPDLNRDRGGQVSDWEESQMLAALAVSELPAALQ